MKTQTFWSIIVLASAGVFLSLATIGAAAPAAPSSTSAAGTWNPPRLPDGQPDVQGRWNAPDEGGKVNGDHNYNVEYGGEDAHSKLQGRNIYHSSIVVDPADGKIPYQPWARARQQDIYLNHQDPRSITDIDPEGRCYPSGVTRMSYGPGGFTMVQFPGMIVMHKEYLHVFRIIYVDSRPHIASNIKLWMGDSRGHWEDTTLVVDVTNQFHGTWFDVVGNFHSDDAHSVERFHFLDTKTMKYEVTIDDPKVYTRPWTMSVMMARGGMNPGNPQAGNQDEVWEDSCHEGNKFLDLALQGKPAAGVTAPRDMLTRGKTESRGRSAK